MKTYQNAFSSGMKSKNSPAKKFKACKRKKVKINIPINFGDSGYFRNRFKLFKCEAC